MPESENIGVIVGYITGVSVRHYRRELKSGGPSATALCGDKPGKGHGWVENLHDAHAEKRMEYPICETCEVAAAS